jgi:hypothetical protein
MEPARWSAGAPASRGHGTRTGSVPQWSPPVFGGSTQVWFEWDHYQEMSQWSPPVVGGSNWSTDTLRER